MKCMTYHEACTPPEPCQSCGRPHGEHHWEWAYVNNRYGGGEIALVPIPVALRHNATKAGEDGR